ncbi:MAG: MoxR family ATPase, partial [Rhodococcus sp. (in: high G+C Gram-positive bacteria)]
TARAPEVEDAVAADVVDLARTLRQLPLRKSPSIAEVIDAARAAVVLKSTGVAVGSQASVREILLTALLKYTSDVQLARTRLNGDEPVTVADEEPAPVAPAERVTVASRPANTTTAVFRGHGGRDRGGIGAGRQGRR